MKPELPLIFAFLAILITGLTGTFLEHEKAHIIINQYAGIPSHTEWSITGALTIPDAEYATPELRAQAYLGHGINESIGYQITPLATMLVGTILICTVYLGNKLERRKTK